MSALFGSSKNMAPDAPDLFGQQPERINTNESARVVPWIAGQRWLGVTWLGDAFDVTTTPVTKKVGKKNQVVGYNYFASFAGLVCGGPVDRLVQIRFDDELVWTGPIDRGDEDYVTLTIESRGTIRFYWGTETQVIDPDLDAAGQGYAYRGQCYLVGDNIFFGADKTNAPNIELEVARWPQPSWLTAGQCVIGGVDANPAAVLWDWWTSARFGLGRSQAELDTVRLAASGATLSTEGFGVSPMLDNEDDVRSLLTRLLEHIDAYPTSYDGLFGFELVRPEAGTVPTLTDADLIDDPSIQADGWTETYDEVKVKYADSDKDGQANSANHHDIANFAITARHRQLAVDRPWVTRHAMAVQIAASIGRVSGLPQMSGSVTVIEPSASGLTVGSVFALQTRDGETLQCRVSERTEPDPGKRNVSLSWKLDTAWANEDHYTATADPIGEAPIYEPAVPVALRILNLPYALGQSDQDTLNFMVARANGYDTAYDIWRAAEASGPYTAASEHRTGSMFSKFATRAELTTGYSAATAVIDDVTGIAFTVDCEDESPLQDDEWDVADALEHKLLAVVGDYGVSSEVQEVLSLFDVVRTGVKTYTAKCVRALYDTRRTTHGIGSELWIQLRESFEADTWPPSSGVTRYYKVQTYFNSAALDLADAAETTHLDLGRNLRPIEPQNLRVNGDSTGAVWTTGSDITVTWDNTSRARTVIGLEFGAAPATDLTAVVLEYWDAAGTTMLATTETSPTGESATVTNAWLVANVNVSFQLRVYGRRDSWLSLLYNSVAVVKV
jgi:hypothetical protein